jgi:hypothetical protein
MARSNLKWPPIATMPYKTWITISVLTPLFFRYHLPLKVLSNENRGGVESGINRSTLINCLVGKCPFSALKGHHHERSIKHLAAAKQLLLEHWLTVVEKSGKTCPRWSIQNIRDGIAFPRHALPIVKCLRRSCPYGDTMIKLYLMANLSL